MEPLPKFQLSPALPETTILKSSRYPEYYPHFATGVINPSGEGGPSLRQLQNSSNIKLLWFQTSTTEADHLTLFPPTISPGSQGPPFGAECTPTFFDVINMEHFGNVNTTITEQRGELDRSLSLSSKTGRTKLDFDIITELCINVTGAFSHFTPVIDHIKKARRLSPVGQSTATL